MDFGTDAAKAQRTKHGARRKSPWTLGAGVALGAALVAAGRWLWTWCNDSSEQAQALAERLGSLLDGLDAVVWQVDPATGRFRFLNERSESLLGYPRHHWMARGIDFFISVVHPEDRPRIAAQTRRCLKYVQGCDVQYRAVRRDGRTVWLRSLVRPNPQGDHLCGISIDITEQRQAEEALAASDRRFRSIFDQAGVGIVEVQPDGKARLANDRFCAMLGYTQAEVTGMHYRDLTHPDDLADDQEQAERLVRGEIDHYTLDKRFVRRDGQPLWTTLTCSAVHDAEESLQVIVAIIQDISAQKQAEADLHQLTQTLEQRVRQRTEELRQATRELAQSEYRERQRIAADLHDDLAQLLLAARLKLDAAQPADASVRQRVEESRDLIAQSMDYVRTLISTLTAASRAELPLDQALHQEAQRIEQAYDLKVAIHADPPSEPLSAEMRDLVLRAGRELLINAAKHAGAPEARLALWRHGTQLCLQVRDEGKGFDPTELEAQDIAPTHFGLHNLRQRMRLMGGDMKLQSAPDVGTEVTLSLPLTENAQA